MTDAVKEEAADGTAPRAAMRRLWLVLPLLVFVALAVLFAFRLGAGDPSRIPSALLDKPAPAFDLPPIENGEVVVEDGQIVDFGKAAARVDDALDLGLVALMPGLVNVHAHLEYTVLRGILEDVAFFPWIRALIGLKTFLTREDWIASATLGAAEMLAAGITTVADAADAGTSLHALIDLLR